MLCSRVLDRIGKESRVCRALVSQDSAGHRKVFIEIIYTCNYGILEFSQRDYL